MNERIRDLAEQAGITTNLDTDYFEKDINKWVDYYSEKFAELIVRDCAEAALAKGRASPDTDFRTGSYVISEYLLSRYGVEE